MRPIQAFHLQPRGALVSLGEAPAAGELPLTGSSPFTFSGRLPKLLYVLLHIIHRAELIDGAGLWSCSGPTGFGGSPLRPSSSIDRSLSNRLPGASDAPSDHPCLCGRARPTAAARPPDA